MATNGRKMVIVPQNILEDLKQRHRNAVTLPPSPVIETTVQLEQELRHILDRTDLSELEKAKAYGQLLTRYRMFYEKATDGTSAKVSTSLPVRASPSTRDVPQTTESEVTKSTPSTRTALPESKNKFVDLVIKSVPQTLQKKATLLIDQIRDHPHMTWNEQGHLVYKGEVVPYSNIVDLVNDTLRKRIKFTPTGWEVFARGLNEINIPQDLVGNADRWKWMENRSWIPKELQQSQFRHSTPIRLRAHKSTLPDEADDSAYISELPSAIPSTPTPGKKAKKATSMTDTPISESRFSPKNLVSRWVPWK
jgi:hypothetical protein